MTLTASAGTPAAPIARAVGQAPPRDVAIDYLRATDITLLTSADRCKAAPMVDHIGAGVVIQASTSYFVCISPAITAAALSSVSFQPSS